MKRVFLVVLFVFIYIGSNAQEAERNTEIEVGDILKIGPAEASKYKYIYFPRPNFIIKRGGIVNYKKVVGSKVIVTSLKEKRDGTLQIEIKKVNGGKFFNSHGKVTADAQNALKSGELSRL
ncbi:hypothetical protein [Maribacter sp. 2308TA10-17]|uniref:hypothetical protein n=1 Tax=Maribacter sp. 2308TA10-17 TaxID=3386276 RepID=UPI0039BCEFFA